MDKRTHAELEDGVEEASELSEINAKRRRTTADAAGANVQSSDDDAADAAAAARGAPEAPSPSHGMCVDCGGDMGPHSSHKQLCGLVMFNGSFVCPVKYETMYAPLIKAVAEREDAEARAYAHRPAGFAALDGCAQAAWQAVAHARIRRGDAPRYEDGGWGAAVVESGGDAAAAATAATSGPPLLIPLSMTALEAAVLRAMRDKETEPLLVATCQLIAGWRASSTAGE